MELISPREFVRLSHDEWARNFSTCVEAINQGTIFVIHGNEALEEIHEKHIRPQYESGRHTYFGPNPPDMHRTQILQKALFSSLYSSAHCFVDAYVRLRRTVGAGAFVGPHIDCYEDLPQNSLNCWISFSHLEADEAIQFLPAHYYNASENRSGHFKSGVYLDRRNRLMPTDSVRRDARSHKINPCEYLIFNSGRTVHCSPFFVRGDRVTCDQRVFLSDTNEDANFAEILNYYALSDIGVFDGKREVQTVLQSLWDEYVNKYDFSICQFRAEVSRSSDSPIEIAERVGLDPGLFLRQQLSQPLDLNHRLIRKWLTENRDCVSWRLRLLDHELSEAQRHLLCRELMSLVPENPTKVYGKALPHLRDYAIPSRLDPDSENILARGNPDNVIRVLDWLQSGLGSALPTSIKARLNKYFSFVLLKKLHPQVTHGY